MRPAKCRPKKSRDRLLPKLKRSKKCIAHVFEKNDQKSGPNAGRIAMRRLNKTEYNNTVRDLLNIDFNPSEDFPADEVGHGFDNIADVQWVSPVHLERYIAAAEQIAERAIFAEPVKPPHRHQDSQYLEPAGPDVPKSKFRPISGDKPESGIFSGPLNNPYQVPADGEYIFKVKLYALPGVPKPEKPVVAKDDKSNAQKDEKSALGKDEKPVAKKDDQPASAKDEKPVAKKEDKPVPPKEGKPIRVALLMKGDIMLKPASDAEAATLCGAAVKSLRPFQIMNTFEIKARNEKDSQYIEVKIPANVGLQRCALAIVKPADGELMPKVFVEWFVLDGPLDTRPAFQRANLSFPADKPKGPPIRDFLKRFVSKAFRRPATPDEIEKYAKIIETADAAGGKWEAGARQAIEAILVSPKFLFRPEFESPSPQPGNQPLGEYELASRLSYFLWSTMPDDELFALAEKKELNKNLEAQVKRMLKDPKARSLTDNFAMQWLQLRRLNNVTPDPKLFPTFSKLKSAMMDETSMFVDAIFREDRSILDLIDANFTFLNESLAKHYGIVDTVGNRAGQKPPKPGGQPIKGKDFQRVTLSDGERGGLLTQASFLTVTSNPTRTSPVKRGKWILEQILGTPPPPPPPDVPSLEKATELTGTFRQKLEQHRSNPNCAGCHARMDPIGFAFENFDAVGVFRTKEGDLPIDASGSLPGGQAFKGAGELKTILKNKKDLFSRCLTEKMMTYALGRGIEVYDRKSVEKIMDALAKDNFRFSTMISGIVLSDQFRMRRAE